MCPFYNHGFHWLSSSCFAGGLQKEHRYQQPWKGARPPYLLVDKCMHLILWPSCWHICWEGLYKGVLARNHRDQTLSRHYFVSQKVTEGRQVSGELCPCVSQALKTSGTWLKTLLLTYLQQSDKHYVYVQRMFTTSLIYIDNNWKHPKCPVIDDLVNQLLDLYTK